MFANTAVLSFFPTPLWVFDLPEAEARRINAEIIGRLDRIASPRPAPEDDLSLQTDHDFHRHPEFAGLQRYVMKAVEGALSVLHVKAEGAEITGCCVNVSPPGIRHHEHTHPNNYLSGVYYLRIPPGGDSINFHDPRPQAHVLSLPAAKGTPFTMSLMTVAAQAGRMILFPAWLRHSVEPNRGSGERISLSFNIMFASFAERYSRPMWKPKLRPGG